MQKQEGSDIVGMNAKQYFMQTHSSLYSLSSISGFEQQLTTEALYHRSLYQIFIKRTKSDMRNFSKWLLRVIFTISVSVLLLADVMRSVAVPVDKTLGKKIITDSFESRII